MVCGENKDVVEIVTADKEVAGKSDCNVCLK